MIEQGTLTSLITLLTITVGILVSIRLAKKGTIPKVRIIPALEAISEVVGRAAEMGKPVHFSPGSAPVTTAEGGQTVASMAILHYLARTCAKQGVRLIATIGNAEALPLMEESIEQGYRLEGELEKFVREDIIYLSGGMRVGTMDVIFKERPAANIMVGGFWGEALLIAETAARVGAMQVGGTARITNLSFIVAVCDYSLIGEELYAAGAFLSGDRELLGSLRGQDVGKIIALLLLVIGFIALNLGSKIMQTILSI